MPSRKQMNIGHHAFHREQQQHYENLRNYHSMMLQNQYVHQQQQQQNEQQWQHGKKKMARQQAGESIVDVRSILLMMEQLMAPYVCNLNSPRNMSVDISALLQPCSKRGVLT
ncbi:uncharacterized protein LOC134290770 [Aedes albopictus]|uniref:Uncharacterized protein n=1 Tax=Aedes albopictus TaxID=7160 RepID=A0ABM2A3P8_AEDAL